MGLTNQWASVTQSKNHCDKVQPHFRKTLYRRKNRLC